jgi:uncharacterized membrane protein
MASDEKEIIVSIKAGHTTRAHPLRFLQSSQHLNYAFGEDWFGQKAESFARYFGTPRFLIAQTVVVAIWIVLNMTGLTHFDVYPFILLNLAFSLQAAYAAPLILLAQTRQADRDKALSEADAQHREALDSASEQRHREFIEQNGKLMLLLEQNTQLTEMTNKLSQRIQELSEDLHRHIVGETG